MNFAAGLLLLLAPVPGDVAQLGWLSGVWTERGADGSWTEEYWTPPRGQLMLGAGMTGQGDSVRHFEQMQIFKDADGTIAFVGMPNGNKGVRFPLVKMTADEVVFENPTHDYPQRVRYRREGATVIATVSLLDGSKENRWVYVKS
jgi:hypothetical protein